MILWVQHINNLHWRRINCPYRQELEELEELEELTKNTSLLKTKIKVLLNKISDIENGVYELEYYSSTTDILLEYYNNNQEDLTDSIM